MGQHNALGEARGIVILGAAILIANIHQAPRRARRDQAFVDEAAHGVDVDIPISRIVLDMRRIGKQDQLHVYAPFSSPASELLDVRRRNQGIAVGIQKQLRPGIGFLGESDRICRNGRSTECLRNYLEEPEYGEEERDDKRHRQIRERMTTDDRADCLEKSRYSSLARRTVEYHSPDLEQCVSLLHRETDVLIQERATVAEDVEENRMLVQSLVGDHLQQPLADVRHLVPAPKQAFHRRRITQRNATFLFVDRAILGQVSVLTAGPS